MKSPPDILSDALALNETLRAQAREAADASFQALAIGETVEFTLPVAQPDRRDCYVVIAHRARRAFGFAGYRLRRTATGVEVTRRD